MRRVTFVAGGAAALLGAGVAAASALDGDRRLRAPVLRLLQRHARPAVVHCDWASAAPMPPPDVVTPTMFTADQLATLATRLAGYIDIPLLPEAAERYVVVQALTAVSQTLAQQLDDKLRKQLRFAMAGSLTSDETQDLVNRLATLVNHKVDLPFLNENEEQALFQHIIGAIIRLAQPSDGAPNATAYSLLQSAVSSAHVLLVPEQRRALAQHITKTYDFPFLNQQQEQVVVENVIEILSQRVNGLLPPEFVATLRGASPAEMQRLKQRLVQRLIETAKVPILRPELRVLLYDRVVSVMLEGIATASGPAFLQDTKTRLHRAQETESLLKAELDEFDEHTAARRRVLAQQLRKVQAERWELQRQTSWLHWLLAWLWFWR